MIDDESSYPLPGMGKGMVIRIPGAEPIVFSPDEWIVLQERVLGLKASGKTDPEITEDVVAQKPVLKKVQLLVTPETFIQLILVDATYERYITITDPLGLDDTAGATLTAHRRNFQEWYAETLNLMRGRRESGFAVMMISLPLLERYLRQKAKSLPTDNMTDATYAVLVSIFPILGNTDTAKDFWQVFRHGLLHKVTMQLENKSGKALPPGALTHDVADIIVTANGQFLVNPDDFAARVIAAIESDFPTYEASDFTGALPVVTQFLLATGSGRIEVSSHVATTTGAETSPRIRIPDRI